MEATDVTQSCPFPQFPLQLLCLTVSDQYPTVNQRYPFGPWNNAMTTKVSHEAGTPGSMAEQNLTEKTLYSGPRCGTLQVTCRSYIGVSSTASALLLHIFTSNTPHKGPQTASKKLKRLTNYKQQRYK